MPLAKNIMLGGFSAGSADAINGQLATGLSAAGTTQGTATAISADVCVVSTVAANSGVILFAGQTCDEQTVYNNGANSLNVYPPTGSKINGIAINGAHILATSTVCSYRTVSSTQMIANLSA